MSKLLPLLLLAAAVPASPPSAGAAEVAAPAKRCDFRAWSKDRDPAGLNVRAAPRRDAAVIARLPAPRQVDGTDFAVEFRVIGASDGWLEIRDAGFGDYGAGGKRLFAGPGWVAAALVDVSVQDERVRRAPAASAAVVDEPKALPDDGREQLFLTRILSCDGRWIEMEGEYRAGDATSGRRVRGWATDLCGNQATTCS